MRIGIAGPITTAALAERLPRGGEGLPDGLGGTPVNALVDGLLRAGHEVSVYTLDPAVHEPLHARGEGLDVYYGAYGASARHRSLTRFAKERAAIRSFVETDGPDVVHAQWTYEFARGALDARADALVTVHDWAARVFSLSPNFYRLARWSMNAEAVRRARRLTAVSPDTASHLPETARGRCVIVPNIVSSSAFAAAARTRSASHDVVCVSDAFGRLKNLPTLLEAFALLVRQLPDARLALIGRGCAPEDALSALAQRRGLAGNVDFVGPVSHDHAIARIASADVLVHPSREESFGMVIAEAMAAGTPVVVGAASGGAPWVAEDGAAGALADVNSPQAISDALARLLTDSGAWNEASRAARESAMRRFSAQVVTRAYLEQYSAVVGE